MNSLTEWFNQLDPILRAYWGIAIFASVIVFIQTTMSFIGIGDVDTGDVDVDFDADTDADADSLDNAIPNAFLLRLVSALVGCLFVAIFIFLFRQMMKLQSNGAFDINDAVGKVCDVYLRIPGQNQGMGKVQISFNGSVQELNARTSGEQISSGAKVRVLRVIEKKVLEVEPV